LPSDSDYIDRSRIRATFNERAISKRGDKKMARKTGKKSTKQLRKAKKVHGVKPLTLHDPFVITMRT
jgi:hypothetical protein